MPFRLFFLPSYERCLRKLGSREREIAGVILLALQSYFQSGIPLGGGPYVFHSKDRSHRLVFKKLRESIWEASVEGGVRVITRQEKDAHFLVFVGNHDQVRQFLKKN
ncbi:MAG: hypothetical protein HYU34_00735 [Candidatus Omnitrophica bacterium]|nr:hypothetical protein [Candidatus Omnitrophota bacterium]